MSYPFIQNENKIVIYKEGESIYWGNEDEFFAELNESLLNSDWEEVDKILDTRKSESKIIEFANGKITYNDGVIFYLGTPIHSVLTKKIVSMIEENYKNIDPMIKFLENLMKNPSKRAVDELYGFLEYANLPITEDGHFIAYKKLEGILKIFTLEQSIIQLVRNLKCQDFQLMIIKTTLALKVFIFVLKNIYVILEIVLATELLF